jgi:hypothetical protein
LGFRKARKRQRKRVVTEHDMNTRNPGYRYKRQATTRREEWAHVRNLELNMIRVVVIQLSGDIVVRIYDEAVSISSVFCGLSGLLAFTSILYFAFN